VRKHHATCNRLSYIAESEHWSAQAAAAETELDKLKVKLDGAKMLGLSAVAAAGGGGN
jgi:hypothetical protein